MGRIIDWVRYDFPQGIKNLIKWFPLVWKDRDWDYEYTLKVLRFKLEKQSSHIKSFNRHTDSYRQAERIDTCIKLLDIVVEENYQFEYQEYENRYPWEKESDKSPKEYFEKYPNDYRRVVNYYKSLAEYEDRVEDDSFILLVMSKHRHERAKKLLFEMISNWVEYWWV